MTNADHDEARRYHDETDPTFWVQDAIHAMEGFRIHLTPLFETEHEPEAGAVAEAFDRLEIALEQLEQKLSG